MRVLTIMRGGGGDGTWLAVEDDIARTDGGILIRGNCL